MYLYLNTRHRRIKESVLKQRKLGMRAIKVEAEEIDKLGQDSSFFLLEQLTLYTDEVELYEQRILSVKINQQQLEELLKVYAPKRREDGKK